MLAKTCAAGQSATASADRSRLRVTTAETSSPISRRRRAWIPRPESPYPMIAIRSRAMRPNLGVGPPQMRGPPDPVTQVSDDRRNEQAANHHRVEQHAEGDDEGQLRQEAQRELLVTMITAREGATDDEAVGNRT